MHGTDIGSPSFELEIEEPKKKETWQKGGKKHQNNTIRIKII